MAQRHDGVRNLLTSLIGKRFAPTLKSNHDYNLSIMSDSTSEAREQARRQDWTSRQEAFSLVELQHFLMSEKRMLTLSATTKKQHPQSLRSRKRRKSGSTNRRYWDLSVGWEATASAFSNAYLAEKLSEKNEEPYHITITWIRTLLSFETVRSVHTCVSSLFTDPLFSLQSPSGARDKI